MKKILIAVILNLFLYHAQAQILKPVKWSYAYKRVSATEVIILLKASIDNGWHIFSQHIGNNGPTKTKFTFQPSTDFKLNGHVAEPKGIVKFQPDFKMQVTYFENEAIFQQKIKLLSSKPTVIKGKLTYGTCDDHQCLPPEDVNFAVAVK